MDEIIQAKAKIVQTQILLELVRSSIRDNEFLLDLCDEIEDELKEMCRFVSELESRVLDSV
jgi:hypothetical protein